MVSFGAFGRSLVLLVARTREDLLTMEAEHRLGAEPSYRSGFAALERDCSVILRSEKDAAAALRAVRSMVEGGGALAVVGGGAPKYGWMPRRVDSVQTTRHGSMFVMTLTFEP